jgi:hypothetical protein
MTQWLANVCRVAWYHVKDRSPDSARPLRVRTRGEIVVDAVSYFMVDVEADGPIPEIPAMSKPTRNGGGCRNECQGWWWVMTSSGLM